MADGLADIWRSALDANLRYYEAWGRAANEYLRDLGDAFKRYSPSVQLPEIKVPVATTQVTSEPARPTRGAVNMPAVVLEAEAGSLATGAVLVQNHLVHPVSAAVVAQIDADAAPDIQVEPALVDLAPGESAVVRVTAKVPTEAPSELTGQLLVPELVGTTVPLVVRARPATSAAGDPPTG